MLIGVSLTISRGQAPQLPATGVCMQFSWQLLNGLKQKDSSQDWLQQMGFPYYTQLIDAVVEILQSSQQFYQSH